MPIICSRAKREGGVTARIKLPKERNHRQRGRLRVSNAGALGSISVSATVGSTPNAAVQSLDISGDISDNGSDLSLTLAGDGTGRLLLGGSNSFSGGMYVVDGALVLNGADAPDRACGSAPHPACSAKRRRLPVQ